MLGWGWLKEEEGKSGAGGIMSVGRGKVRGRVGNTQGSATRRGVMGIIELKISA